MEALKSFLKSFATAFQGLVHVVRLEQNARFHLLIAILVLLMAVFFGVSNIELAAIFFAVIVVFVAEVFNTAIEKTLDIVEPDHSSEVKVIKDIAAGAVLVAAVGAAVIGLAVFTPYITEWMWPLS